MTSPHAGSLLGPAGAGAGLCVRLSVACFALAMLLASTRAHADPTPADKETARRLMSEGRAHRRDGDAKAALQSFLAADAIMHVPTTGLEVAKTEVELGQLVEARDQVLSIARLQDAGNEGRAFTEARETAKTLGAELASRIPSLLVKILNGAPGAAVKVTVDGVPIPPVALVAPRAVDPGHHVVAASVGGSDPKQAEVDVKEGETKEVPIDLASATDGSSSSTPDKPNDGTGPPPARIASYVSFGIGGAGLVVGAVTGILAITKLSAAKGQGCVNDNCPPAASSDLSTASTMATISTVGFIVGGVGVGGGIVAFVLSRGAASHPADSPSAAPAATSLYFGPGSVGVRGSF